MYSATLIVWTLVYPEPRLSRLAGDQKIHYHTCAEGVASDLCGCGYRLSYGHYRLYLAKTYWSVYFSCFLSHNLDISLIWYDSDQPVDKEAQKIKVALFHQIFENWVLLWITQHEPQTTHLGSYILDQKSGFVKSFRGMIISIQYHMKIIQSKMINPELHVWDPHSVCWWECTYILRQVQSDVSNATSK